MPYETKIGVLDGDRWEEYAHRFLRIRYLADCYQTVPARFGGDLGIESFTLRTGVTFQCYYPKEDYPAKELYTHQRDKITTDIGKLIRRGSLLQDVIGSQTIKEWHFITPYYDHKDLLKHARRKEKDVRDAQLPHVDNKFVILLETEDDYSIEIQQILAVGLHQLHVSSPRPTLEELTAWGKDNNALLRNLIRKSRIIHPSNESERARFVKEQLRCFLIGQHVLGKLQIDLPEAYDRLLSLKTTRERKISLCAHAGAPGSVLIDAINNFESDLNEMFQHAIALASRADLAMGVTAEWLLRCPLSFRNPVSS